MLKKSVHFALLFFLCCPVVFAQLPGMSEDNSFPSVDDMVNSLNNEESSEKSIDASIDAFKKSMTEQMQSATSNTPASVHSAIEGDLVVEEVVPEVNRKIVETVDSGTKRYSPRLKLNFVEFPLRPLSGRISNPVENGDSTDVFEQTNSAITTDIARRIQGRLQVPGIRFEFKDRMVKLTGTVKTIRQRELAEMMVRLEPGIDTVKNEIIVAKD
jgi:hypothetical protein